jgi:hypothetical protein
MAFILTRPANSSGSGDFTNISADIGAGNTVSVDGYTTTGLKAMKWLVTIEDTTDTKIVSFEVYAVNKFGVDASHTIYARIGDRNIQYNTDVVISGGFMNLSITNNEAHQLSVYASRVEVTEN